MTRCSRRTPARDPPGRPDARADTRRAPGCTRSEPRPPTSSGRLCINAMRAAVDRQPRAGSCPARAASAADGSSAHTPSTTRPSERAARARARRARTGSRARACLAAAARARQAARTHPRGGTAARRCCYAHSAWFTQLGQCSRRRCVLRFRHSYSIVPARSRRPAGSEPEGSWADHGNSGRDRVPG